MLQGRYLCQKTTRSIQNINKTLGQYDNLPTHISFLQKSFSNASKYDQLEAVRDKKKLKHKTTQCRKGQKALKKRQTASFTERLVTFMCTTAYKSCLKINSKKYHM